MFGVPFKAIPKHNIGLLCNDKINITKLYNENRLS
nr:MAG TPA: hypothetical protein [Caudoviricetes sp.]